MVLKGFKDSKEGAGKYHPDRFSALSEILSAIIEPDICQRIFLGNVGFNASEPTKQLKRTEIHGTAKISKKILIDLLACLR